MPDCASHVTLVGTGAHVTPLPVCSREEASETSHSAAEVGHENVATLASRIRTRIFTKLSQKMLVRSRTRWLRQATGVWKRKRGTLRDGPIWLIGGSFLRVSL